MHGDALQCNVVVNQQRRMAFPLTTTSKCHVKMFVFCTEPSERGCITEYIWFSRSKVPLMMKLVMVLRNAGVTERSGSSPRRCKERAWNILPVKDTTHLEACSKHFLPLQLHFSIKPRLLSHPFQ